MIRNAQETDINSIIEIIEKCKKIMYQEENYQWTDGYPSEKLILNDIKKYSLYVFEEEGIVKGFISIEKNADESYEEVIERTTKEDCYVFHRLAVSPDFQNQKIATKLLDFGEKQAKKENVLLIKADTGVQNRAMIHLFQKSGYKQLTTFSWDDYPGTFLYFEKRLGSEKNEI